MEPLEPTSRPCAPKLACLPYVRTGTSSPWSTSRRPSPRSWTRVTRRRWNQGRCSPDAARRRLAGSPARVVLYFLLYHERADVVALLAVVLVPRYERSLIVQVSGTALGAREDLSRCLGLLLLPPRQDRYHQSAFTVLLPT